MPRDRISLVSGDIILSSTPQISSVGAPISQKPVVCGETVLRIGIGQAASSMQVEDGAPVAGGEIVLTALLQADVMPIKSVTHVFGLLVRGVAAAGAKRYEALGRNSRTTPTSLRRHIPTRFASHTLPSATDRER